MPKNPFDEGKTSFSIIYCCAVFNLPLNWSIALPSAYRGVALFKLSEAWDPAAGQVTGGAHAHGGKRLRRPGVSQQSFLKGDPVTFSRGARILRETEQGVLKPRAHEG